MINKTKLAALIGGSTRAHHLDILGQYEEFVELSYGKAIKYSHVFYYEMFPISGGGYFYVVIQGENVESHTPEWNKSYNSKEMRDSVARAFAQGVYNSLNNGAIID